MIDTVMIKLWGGSDDLFYVSGASLGDFNENPVEGVADGSEGEEFGGYNRVGRLAVLDTDGKPSLYAWAHYFTIDFPGEQLGGTWTISVTQGDEDRPIPWPVRIGNAHGYSPALEVDVPRGTRIVFERFDSLKG